MEQTKGMIERAERIYQYQQKLEREIQQSKLEAKENLKNRKKKVRVYENREFANGFDTMKEAKAWIMQQAKELWIQCKEDFKILGYFPPCDVHNYKEAVERSKKFFEIRTF